MTTESNLTLIGQDVYAAREVFSNVLIDKRLNFEAEAGFAMQQLGKNDYMQKAAIANRQAVFDAVVNIAAIGISLNPAKKQAYLVPRDGKICLDISYLGLMDLAQATGSVKWAQAALVYEADTFSLIALDKAPVHTFNPFSKDRGAVVGVYVTIKTVHDEYLTHTMTIDECLAIRDRSAAWKVSKSGPWKTDENEMIKKTCVKQGSKYWPRADRLDAAIHHLNEGGEGLAVLMDQTPQKTSPVIPATPMVELATDREQIVKAVANAVTDLFNSDDLVGAYGEYIGITDGDEKVALWKLLPSNIRSALKKHGATLIEPT